MSRIFSKWNFSYYPSHIIPFTSEMLFSTRNVNLSIVYSFISKPSSTRGIDSHKKKNCWTTKALHTKLQRTSDEIECNFGKWWKCEFYRFSRHHSSSADDNQRKLSCKSDYIIHLECRSPDKFHGTSFTPRIMFKSCICISKERRDSNNSSSSSCRSSEIERNSAAATTSSTDERQVRSFMKYLSSSFCIRVMRTPRRGMSMTKVERGEFELHLIVWFTIPSIASKYELRFLNVQNFICDFVMI